MKQITGIARDTLHFILEAGKSTAPFEFAGLLREEGGIITEVIVLPGTESGESSALIHMYMLPSMHIAGSVHSHPSPSLQPSEADLELFGHTGNCHIIACSPFRESNWACYDSAGNRRELPVLDIPLEDM